MPEENNYISETFNIHQKGKKRSSKKNSDLLPRYKQKQLYLSVL